VERVRSTETSSSAKVAVSKLDYGEVDSFACDCAAKCFGALRTCCCHWLKLSRDLSFQSLQIMVYAQNRHKVFAFTRSSSFGRVSICRSVIPFFNGLLPLFCVFPFNPVCRKQSALCFGFCQTGCKPTPSNCSCELEVQTNAPKFLDIFL
jgi:hypothetical protein